MVNRMRLIDADTLMQKLDIHDTCDECPYDIQGMLCQRSCDFADACQAITDAPTVEPDLSDYSDKLWAAAYERGKAEAVRWIPCSEQPAEPNSLACDKFGQVFITLTVVDINGKCYDGTEFAFNVEEFLKGKLIGDGVRVLPTEIIARMPLPEPYKEGDTK